MSLANTTLNRFRIISYIEGLSYLVLIFLAMPLKYLNENQILMKNVGMAHGILFILFIIFLFNYVKKHNITKAVTFDLFVYSLTPYGFLLIEKRIKMLGEAK